MLRGRQACWASLSAVVQVVRRSIQFFQFDFAIQYPGLPRIVFVTVDA